MPWKICAKIAERQCDKSTYEGRKCKRWVYFVAFLHCRPTSQKRKRERRAFSHSRVVIFSPLTFPPRNRLQSQAKPRSSVLSPGGLAPFHQDNTNRRRVRNQPSEFCRLKKYPTSVKWSIWAVLTTATNYPTNTSMFKHTSHCLTRRTYTDRMTNSSLIPVLSRVRRNVELLPTAHL